MPPGGGVGLYSDAEIHRAMDDAIRVANAHTGYVQQTTSHSNFTVANQSIYSVPSGYLFFTKVALSGRVLDKTSVKALSNRHPEWLGETTTNTGIPVSRWAPIGLNRFCLHPAPSTANLTITCSGVKETSSLTLDTSVIPFPDEMSDMVEDLVVHYLQLKEGGLIFNQAVALYQKFLSKMKELSRYSTYRNPRFYVEAVSPE
jgi:hypothetical protein